MDKIKHGFIRYQEGARGQEVMIITSWCGRHLNYEEVTIAMSPVGEVNCPACKMSVYYQPKEEETVAIEAEIGETGELVLHNATGRLSFRGTIPITKDQVWWVTTEEGRMKLARFLLQKPRA